MKRATAGEILSVARRVVELARGRALVLVNDRPDLALLADADGVHLGDEDLPVEEARRLLGADHVGYGPVFPSLTKPLDVAPRGLEGLALTCASSPVPVVAISGITVENVEAVARCGAAAAALVGDLFDHGDPRPRAEALVAAFARGAQGAAR